LPAANILTVDDPFLIQNQWGPQQEEAFVKLKSALTSQPILELRDFKSTFFVQTDVSDRGLGAVLLQWENDVRIPEFAHPRSKHQ
jgi:hypothetical protein